MTRFNLLFGNQSEASELPENFSFSRNNSGIPFLSAMRLLFPFIPRHTSRTGQFLPKKQKKTFHSDSVSLPIPGQSSEMSINRQTGQCCCCCCCPGKCLGELPNYINFHPTTHELCHFFLSISLNWITPTSSSPFLIDRREWFWQIDTCPGIVLFRSFKTAQYMIPYVLMVVLEFYLF